MKSKRKCAKVTKLGKAPRRAMCHPERQYEAKGLCYSCYTKEHRLPHRLKAKYGLTLRQFLTILSIQNGVCALCKQLPQKGKLHIDHDHKTKRVRGLLCDPCNRFKVGSNTIEDIQAVLQYLSREFDGRSL